MEYTVDAAGKAAVDQATIGVPVKSVNVAVSSAEILALFTTPKVLVPAPGAGKVLEFCGMVVVYDRGSASYTTNGDLYVKNATTGTILSDTIAGAAALLAATDAVRAAQPLSADQPLAPNEALVLQVGTGNPAAGNGILRVRCFYREHVTGL